MDYIKKLEKIVGKDNVKSDEIEKICYSRDMSVHEALPDVIVFPTTKNEIIKIVKLCNKEKIPITARGAGTNVVGAALPAKGGIVLDICRMNKILEVKPEDRYVVVQPGVICAELNKEIVHTNFFFPPNPGSSEICTLGGMVSTNASGHRAAKYGTTKDYILGMEVVLSDGRVLKTGTKVPKTSSGYDLTRLFVGSEGTLGIITEITLKIIPIPPYVAFATSNFDTVNDAGKAVSTIYAEGIDLAVCEILDRISIDVLNKAMDLNLPDVEAILIMEIDGFKDDVKKQIKKLKEICVENNGKKVKWSDKHEDRLAMWQGRKGLVASMSRYKKGWRLIPIAEDFGVPMSRIPEAIKGIQNIAKANNMIIATFGHVGDGNLHSTFISDVRDKKGWKKIKKVSKELIDLALELDGTVTAEHGTGMAKAPFIGKEHGIGMEFMKKIKNTFDPNDIMNPGKLSLDDTIKDIYDFFAFKKLVEHPSQIKSFGKDIDDEILVCVQCGFCRAGCPIFAQKGTESANARGRSLLAFSLLTDVLNPSPEVAEKFYLCTMCRNCTQACPCSIRIDEIVQSCRNMFFENGIISDSHKMILENLENGGNPFGESKEKRTDTYPFGYEKNEKADVLLYLGCVTSYQDTNIVPSIMKLLDKAGVKYTTLGNDESCCGYVDYLIGSDKYKEYINSNTKKFKDLKIKKIITPCAGCYKTFKELYPKHSNFDFKVYHAIEYIEKLTKKGKLKFENKKPLKIIYHDPCDLGRHMGIYEEPRKILKRIPNIELLEFERNRENAKCCGGGGAMKAYDSELSANIAYEKVIEASDMGAKIIVSGCPSCKGTLKAGVAKLKKEKGKKMRVMDITEIVRKYLK